MRTSATQQRTRFVDPVHKLSAALAALALIFFPAHAVAHPMGNFSISHYTGITVGRGFLELHYLIDMAEIPTFQEMQQSGIVARPGDPRLPAYLSAKAAEFARGLHLTLNGGALPLRVVSQDVIFPTGAGNLPTMKFGFGYSAEISADCTAAPCQLDYEDTNFPGRAGWKEVIVTTGEEISLIRSTAPVHDRSDRLSNYPSDLINSPAQLLQASLIFSMPAAFAKPPSSRIATASGGSHNVPVGRRSSSNQAPAVPVNVSPVDTPSSSADGNIQVKPNRQATPRNAFTELMATKQVNCGIALLAALIAAGLGALHALEPGHGKTIVAAYLVGSNGTARHALLLGTIVTISHTAGVYLLGAMTLYAQKYILPDRIYPFLGVLSGMLIAGTGCFLFLQRYLGGEFAHSHKDISSSAEFPAPGIPKSSARISARRLLVLGVTGGMVPCPAALVVLLSAVTLHRTAFGLFLIVTFSIGLAAVLIAMGLAAVYAGRAMSRLPFEAPLIQRWLPMASALLISVVGCGIAIRGLMAAGIMHIRLLS
jgi:ABC-type nickel/cobalt efflux system permease component RcnA